MYATGISNTGAVYRDASREPIREDTTCEPVNPYGSSKRMVEQILSDYRKAYGLRLICFRYFNASGADPSGLIGELRDPETHLIAWAIRLFRVKSRILRCLATTTIPPPARLFATIST